VRRPTGSRVVSSTRAWPSYLAYAVTFLLIGQVWANHHVMFEHIRVADRTVLFLNTLLLMDIAHRVRGADAISRRFRLALVWLGTGTVLGALVPVLGMAVIAAFIPFYWRPIPGEIARAKREGRDRT
jgi:hypothetical protein